MKYFVLIVNYAFFSLHISTESVSGVSFTAYLLTLFISERSFLEEKNLKFHLAGASILTCNFLWQI